MDFLYKTIVTDTINQSGQTFSVDEVIGFTINNTGNTDCYLSYRGKSNLMKIEQGTSRKFESSTMTLYKGEMQIKFIGSEYGLVEVIKNVVSANEN